MIQKMKQMNVKKHYRLYKSGKLWVIAGLATVALFDAVALAPQANAATMAETQTTQVDNATSDGLATVATDSSDTADVPAVTSDVSGTQAISESAPATQTVDGAEKVAPASQATATSLAAESVTQAPTTTATAQEATQPAAITTSATNPTAQLSARTGTTSQVTAEMRANGNVFDSSTEAIPVGTTLNLTPEILMTDSAGQQHLLQYQSHTLNNGTASTDLTVTIPDETATNLAIDYVVDPALTLTVAHSIDTGVGGSTMIQVAQYAGEGAPSFKPRATFTNTDRETLVIDFSPLAQSGQMTNGNQMPAQATFEFDNAAQTVAVTTDGTTQAGDYNQVIQQLDTYGIHLDGTVMMPDYLTFAMFDRLEFTSYPNAVAGTHQVSVSYTYVDGLTVDPTENEVLLTATDEQLTTASQIEAGGYSTTLHQNISGDTRNNALLGSALKQIVIDTSATDTAPARTYTYTLSDYENGTYNKVYVTMKPFVGGNPSTTAASHLNAANVGDWYAQMAAEEGMGIAYINDGTNQAADRLLATLEGQGINVDGIVNFASYADFAKIANVRFVYVDKGMLDPNNQDASYTYQLQTTTGRILATNDLGTVITRSGYAISAGGSFRIYRNGVTQYLASAYQQKIPDANGNLVQVVLPYRAKAVDFKETDSISNIVEITTAEYTKITGETTYPNSPLSTTDTYPVSFSIIAPSQPVTFVQTIQELPSEIVVNYQTTSGSSLAATQTLQSTVMGNSGPEGDALDSANISLATHGPLRQIIVKMDQGMIQYLKSTDTGAKLDYPETEYVRYIFNGDQAVLAEAYNDPSTILDSGTLNYADAVAFLQQAGVDVNGSVGMPNLIEFAITDGITFIYQPASTLVNEDQTTTQLTVNYVDENGKTIAPSATQSGKVSTSFKVTAPVLAHYNLISPKQTVSGQYQGNQMTLTFNYKAVPQVVNESQTMTQLTVHYVDKNGKTIIPSTTQNGKVGTNFSVTAPTLAHYNLISPKQAVSGQYQGNQMTLTFNYKAVPQVVDESQTVTQLTVHYVDQNGNKIALDATQRGQIGTHFVVSAPQIENYQLIGPKQLVTGQYQGDTMTLTFTYQAVTATPTIMPDQPETTESINEQVDQTTETKQSEIVTPVIQNQSNSMVSASMPTVKSQLTATPQKTISKATQLPQTDASAETALVSVGLVSVMLGLFGLGSRKKQH